MKEKFIITIKAENRPGLVSQITGLLNRKQLEMESISAAKTDISSVVMITIELLVSENALRPLIVRLENIIEVYAVDVVKSMDAMCHQIAYFKLSKELLNTPQSSVLRKFGVQFIDFYPDAILISKSGTEAEIRRTYNELDGLHLMGFMKSGLIAVTTLIDSDEVRVITTSAMEDQSSVISVAA